VCGPGYAVGAGFSGTTYGDFPKPEFPIEGKVTNGDRVRGKIAYAVPDNQRPRHGHLRPDGLPEPSSRMAMPAS
jgi:hypothetical protein